MKLKDAIWILMQAGSRDSIGQGLGIRATSDKWRKEIAEAWTVCFKYIHKRAPTRNEYFNNNIQLPFIE